MRKFGIVIAALVLFTALASGKGLKLDHSDEFEIVMANEGYITYVNGDVVFSTETGKIFCDSARWVKGQNIRLNGHVIIDDAEYKITGDSVFYNMERSEVLALGQKVEIWSYADSLYATGRHAFYNENDSIFIMEQRPILFLNYPDTARMIQVIGDLIEYNMQSKGAEANGSVQIISDEFSSESGCALMNTKGDKLELFQKPAVLKDESTISGELISMYFLNDDIDYIDVVDSARGEFKEPIFGDTTYYDESLITGKRLKIFFDHGLMDNILCYGQAYSWYYPSSRGKAESHENTVSGDSIRLIVDNESVYKVDVSGSSIGQYISSTNKVDDSGKVILVIDTIDYSSQDIEYNLRDSLIVLNKFAKVKSGVVQLESHEVLFNTKTNMIEAFSADVTTDTVVNPYLLSNEVQPNIIPVILRDGEEEIYGDYLIYSIDTEKGRIIQSKTDFNQGYYYGKKLFREQKDVFYVENGRYTTCSDPEPHFHFKSSNMKMIENDKLIARPVVFYIEKIPLLALPYYVFPLKKGRHSGFLPFTFGQFERGDRYVKNVGYYWAASEYWDWQGSIDYYETNRTINFRNKFSFNKRYVMDGYIQGNYTRQTNYIASSATESKRTRWTLNGAYNHTITPSFSIRSFVDIVSDNTYYNDYSQNFDDILNQSTKSQVSFSKQFSKSVSLSGRVTHTEDLDAQSRTDDLPSLGLSLPTIYPFGSGGKNSDGRYEQKWWQKFSVRYNPSFINYSTRSTLDNITYDTLTTPDTTIITSDTSSYRSYRHYSKITHNPSINLPQINFGNYLSLIPSISYRETWYKIYETDQSQAADIEATTYRAYSYSAGMTARTKLYGTIYPNIFGLIGLRHVLEPTLGYSYSPDINKHPEVRSFAGGGPGSSKSRILTFRLNNLIQAKVRQGENEKALDIFSINTGFSYNYENKERPYSDLSTSFQIYKIPLISSLSGSMVHSLYKPDSDELDFWSPYMKSFNVRASLRLAGKTTLFDETGEVQIGVDSAKALTPTEVNRPAGWSVTLDYNFSESGIGSAYTKSSYIDLRLNFNLTPTTAISYSQNYSVHKGLTTRSSVNIIKKIHCWTGRIYWVPVGTNRGFGFQLNVTDIPAIKLDNNYGGFTNSIQSL